MSRLVTGLSVTSIVFCGAIFGFFYAWVCSTMWGLDQADPRVAITAMQAMNASVRNAVFFPAFFLTPAILSLTSVVAYLQKRRQAAAWFAAAAAIYLTLGLFLTLAVNVPMNEKLASVAVPQRVEAAREVWEGYSNQWQFWNQIRTAASGAALVFAALGLAVLRPASKVPVAPKTPSEHRPVQP